MNYRVLRMLLLLWRNWKKKRPIVDIIEKKEKKTCSHLIASEEVFPERLEIESELG